MSQILCAGPCRPEVHGGPRQAMPGYAICDICEERTWENLHWIADHWRDLEQQLTSSGMPADGMPRPTSRDAVGISLNDKVAETRRQVIDSFRYWTQVILSENTGFTGPKDDAVSMARYLATHVRRITRHHDAGLSAALPIDVSDLRRAVFRHAFPSGARLFTPEPEVACAEHTVSEDGERVACPGHYQTWLSDRSDGTLPDLHCSEDREHTLSPAGFKRAGRTTIKAEAAMRFATKIAG